MLASISMYRLYWRAFLTFLVASLLFLAPSVEAEQTKCTWLYLITQGDINVKMYHTQWQLGRCPNGLVQYLNKDGDRSTMTFPFLWYILSFSPVPSFSLNKRRLTYVDVSVPCGRGATLPCSSAVVYYVVEPAAVDLNVQGHTSVTSQSVWHTHEPIHVPVGTSLSINALAGVDICPDLSIEILSQNRGHRFSLMRSASGEPVLNFDANSSDTKEGEFSARIRITCNSDPIQEIIFDQTVVITPPTNFPLLESHPFSASFHPLGNKAGSVDKPQAKICALEYLPNYNDNVFESSFLDKSGGFSSGGLTASIDSSILKIRCSEEDSTQFESYYVKTVNLFEDAQPSNVCPGVFDYDYMLNTDSTFSPKLSSLTARASVQSSSFCPTNQFKNAVLITQPKTGSISNFNAADGTFLYTPFTPSVAVDMDSFNFTLTCTASPFTTCMATARISITPEPANSSVYHNKSNHITCKGSCVRGNSTRKDGHAVGSIDFDFSQNGNLIIYAYMTLDSLKSHFVTFTPFVNGSGYCTSASAPNSALVSFESSCLDRQSTQGKAADVVLPNGGGLNLLTDSYKLGDNYYQKFGGMHQQCDIYRSDPCRFAPFMTPNTHNSNDRTPIVNWSLYVDDCDATYVGTASVESLRALQNPDGTATFKLTGDTVLKGTVYMNTLTPVDLESPDKGFVVNSKAHDVNVAIRSTITVFTTEVKEAGDGAVHIVSDIQYAFGKDADTNERLYAYSVHMYPRRMVDDKIVNVDTHDVSMQSSSLVYYEFASPSRLECPECTGTRMRCKGLGLEFETDCGNGGIVTFERYDAAKFSFSHPSKGDGSPYIFPRQMSDIGSYYELIFTLRVSGRNSYNSVDAAPVGTFLIHVRLSNDQVFSVKVDQRDYVSLINNDHFRPQMCTATSYWPVPDILGNSTPVNPFQSFPFANVTGVVVDNDFSMPKPLMNASMCNLSLSRINPEVNLSSLDVILPNSCKDTKATLCAHEQEYIFGVKDWVFVTIPSIKERSDGTIITPYSFSSVTYTVAELQYILLRVPLNETVAVAASDLKANEYFDILLEGNVPLGNEITMEETDEYPFTYNKAGRYYSWSEVTPFLKYRRVRYAAVDSDEKPVTVPFSFVFTPGTLLDHNSSINVPMYLQVSLKFTTLEGISSNARVINETEDKFLYIFHVTHGISAATQFDTQAYKIAMAKLKGAFGQKSATALFVFLLIAVIATLLVSIYIEAKFKRIIHRCKYHTSNAENSLGISSNSHADKSIDNNNSNMEQDGTTSISVLVEGGGGLVADNDNKGDSLPIRTKFGVLGTEQTRVDDNGDREFKLSTGEIRCSTMGALRIEKEEKRVQDDEIAEF